jgi:DNA replication and repair protein RecF
MYLRTITLTGFKNYSGIDFQFTPAINFLYGPNGSGKTNLLDAIHYLSTCKSFLVNTDIQNIQAGQAFFFIEGELESEPGKSDRLQCAVKKGEGKVFRKNKKEYEKLSDHFGFFPSVVISPSDHDLLHGGSAEKRRFMDSLISVYDKKYLDDLIQYGKVLEHRNATLKSIRETGIVQTDLLDIYDEQLDELAHNMHAQRVDMAAKIIPFFMDMYAALSGTDEFPEMRLKADLSGGMTFRQLLRENRNRDLSLTYTSVGPHKDDLEFYLAGRPAKSAASQVSKKRF